MRRFLCILGRGVWEQGLRVVLPGGAVRAFGPAPQRLEWVIHAPAALRRMARNPELALGETYMDGLWEVRGGTLPDLLGLLLRSLGDVQSSFGRAGRMLRAVVQQWNRVQASYRNVAHHYDLDDWLFELFLDRDLHYSCAYFRRPDFSLEEAQQAKCEHIRRKLLLEPGQTVLDIGSGWGSLALYLARHAGVRVTGITLSRRQLAAAQRRARERGLDGEVQFQLQDYREHRGQYDRVVSVGMFEHVGRPYYRAFFDRVRDCLRPGGIALLHSICRLGPPSVTNAWVRRHIFPGGYNPSLSEMLAAVERSGLRAADLEVLRLHYAQTLAAWQARFQASRAQVAERLGTRFCRMWEFYLAAAEAALRHGDLAVAQLQLGAVLGTVPLTRDYLYRGALPQLVRVRSAS